MIWDSDGDIGSPTTELNRSVMFAPRASILERNSNSVFSLTV